MSFTPNEEFPWNMDSNTGPITTPPLSQLGVKRTSEGNENIHALIMTSRRFRQNRITTPLGSSSVKVLISNLFKPTDEERLAAVRAIEAAGREACWEAVSYLQAALRDDPSNAVRVAVAETLGILGEYAPIRDLVQALRDDSFWDVRAAAAQSLGKLGGQTPVQHLVEILGQEGDESVRDAIVRALGEQGKAMPIDVLVGVLYRDKNWLVREAAASALGNLRKDMPVTQLIHVLCNDPDESVRAAAARSLGYSCSPNAEGPLFEALEDDSEDEEVHEAATWALQQLEKELYQREHQEETYLYDEAEALLLEDFFPNGISALKRQSQIDQAFDTLMQFMGDKRGFVRRANLLKTEAGLVLRMDCLYQSTESSLQDTVLRSVKDSNLIEPIEAALKSQDGIVQEVVKQALETGKKRKWFELLIVSFALTHPTYERERIPLRVVMSGIGCHRVREDDTAVLDQIEDALVDTLEDPVACEHPLDLADLKVWYHQPPSHHSARKVAMG